MDELSPRILPKSALTYAGNQRAALGQFVSNRRLTIDNDVTDD
jgi:hypothetical protein